MVAYEILSSEMCKEWPRKNAQSFMYHNCAIVGNEVTQFTPKCCSQLLDSATLPISGFSHTCPVVNSMFGVVPLGHLEP